MDLGALAYHEVITRLGDGEAFVRSLSFSLSLSLSLLLFGLLASRNELLFHNIFI